MHRKVSTECASSSSDEEFVVEMPTESQRDGIDQDDRESMAALDILTIKDIFEICKRKCGSRALSTLIYLILRFSGHSWRSIDELLDQIGAHRCETSHKWSEAFLFGDFEAFMNDGRGGKHHESLYDVFPELESDGRAFATAHCSEKSASFKVSDLAQFIDHKFYDVTGTTKMNDDLIRSQGSCRLDLRRWGATFEKNSQRPYFEGHERADVVKHREDFTSYFVNRMNHYYSVSPGDQPIWQYPSLKPCVALCA